VTRTQAEIDAAAKAIAGDNWDGARWRETEWYRERARAALDAADAVRDTITVDPEGMVRNGRGAVLGVAVPE